MDEALCPQKQRALALMATIAKMTTGPRAVLSPAQLEPTGQPISQIPPARVKHAISPSLIQRLSLTALPALSRRELHASCRIARAANGMSSRQGCAMKNVTAGLIDQ